MIDTRLFGEKLREHDFDFYSGVPCSFLKDLINYAMNEQEFVMAANEGDAVAICAGASLGGKKSVFLCQNSGLANAVSPLTSLIDTFSIPLLGFVSLRGEEGLQDEPQHELMGKITGELLKTMGIAHEILSQNFEEAIEQIQKAISYIENNQPFFFIVRKGTFSKVLLKNTPTETIKEVTSTTPALDYIASKRLTTLATIKDYADTKGALVLATTGLTGRELYELGDSKNQLYMVGSMGCVSSLALGLSLAQPHKQVIAIDGDGALLMRLGTMSTLGYYTPKNLCHILLDNGAHESTGGQFTVSSSVNFIDIARATHYTTVVGIKNLVDLSSALAYWHDNQSLTFLYCKTELGVKADLGRPTVTPQQVKERFMNYIKTE